MTGLYLMPDGMDLAAEEVFDNWRRTPDHLAFYGRCPRAAVAFA